MAPLPAAGYAYYLPGDHVPPESAGWTEDRITNGGLNLILIGDKEAWDVDILYESAGETAGSLTAEGFNVYPLTQPPAAPLIIAIHPDGSALDHYLFELNDSGKPVGVVWVKCTKRPYDREEYAPCGGV